MISTPQRTIVYAKNRVIYDQKLYWSSHKVTRYSFHILMEL
jgi:hypothetical protein